MGHAHGLSLVRQSEIRLLSETVEKVRAKKGYNSGLGFLWFQRSDMCECT